MHEIGHALGAHHDFDTQLRYAQGISHLEAGCNHQGWMSYGEHPTEFSTCSFEDFKSHYNGILKKHGKWCLSAAPDACN